MSNVSDQLVGKNRAIQAGLSLNSYYINRYSKNLLTSVCILLYCTRCKIILHFKKWLVNINLCKVKDENYRYNNF